MRMMSILERRKSSAPVPLVDEVADVGAPFGHHSGEGSGHALVALQLLELLYIRGCRYDGSLLRCKILIVLVNLLLSDRVGFDQILIALGRYAGKREIGLRLIECGACAYELLVHFRRVDFSENLAAIYVRAYIRVPVRDVSIGAGIDR